MEEEGGSLKDEIRKLNESVGKLAEGGEKKPREFKLPFSKRVKGASAKKNYATVMLIQENGEVTFKKEKIDNQVIHIDGVPRIATGDMVLRYKKNPMIIQPSWSVKPFSPTENYADTEKQNLNVKGYKLLMTIMKQEAISKKTSFGWGLAILGLIIAGVIVYALFFGK
jgi:hypothetical protein